MDTRPTEGRNNALARFGITAGPRIGQDLPIESPVVSIGSGPQNDVVIPDDSVSKIHARLEYADGAWRLTDLNSTNGTYVEGVRLAPEVPTPVDYGFSVRFGGMRLQLRPVEKADPEAARESYTPPPEPTTIRARGATRFPVWLVVLALIVVLLAILYFAGVFTGDPATAPTVGGLELAPGQVAERLAWTANVLYGAEAVGRL
jgi:hypothetical protein